MIPFLIVIPAVMALIFPFVRDQRTRGIICSQQSYLLPAGSREALRS